MVETQSLLVLLGLPLWLGPPLLLLIVVTRARAVRIAFGAGLAAVLTFLYAVACQFLQGPGLPIWIEGLVLWGPTTLAGCGAAFLTDRWLARRRDSGTLPGSGQTSSTLAVRRRLSVAVFVGWSVFCGGCVSSPVPGFVDVRFDSPTPGLVLPMPNDLTLVSADRGCGSEKCSETYLVGSPDQASVQELTDRLWAHLVGTKGWRRLRDDAGCQRTGWFIQHEFCLFVNVEQAGPVAALKVRVPGSLTVST